MVGKVSSSWKDVPHAMADAKSLALTISGGGTTVDTPAAVGKGDVSERSLKGDDNGLEARLPYKETAADAESNGDEVGLGWLAPTLDGLPIEDTGLVSIEIGECVDLAAIGDATMSSCSWRGSSSMGCSGSSVGV